MSRVQHTMFLLKPLLILSLVLSVFTFSGGESVRGAGHVPTQTEWVTQRHGKLASHQSLRLVNNIKASTPANRISLCIRHTRLAHVSYHSLARNFNSRDHLHFQLKVKSPADPAEGLMELLG